MNLSCYLQNQQRRAVYSRCGVKDGAVELLSELDEISARESRLATAKAKTRGSGVLTLTLNAPKKGYYALIMAIRSWYKIKKSGIQRVGDLVHYASTLGRCPKIRRRFIAICYILLWSLWKARNERQFRNMFVSTSRVVENIKYLTYLWIKCRGKGVCCTWEECSSSSLSILVTNRYSWAEQTRIRDSAPDSGSRGDSPLPRGKPNSIKRNQRLSNRKLESGNKNAKQRTETGSKTQDQLHFENPMRV
ncbi:hypothetical protein LXL04_005342 [Taraxacum kok-saghyz]